MSRNNHFQGIGKIKSLVFCSDHSLFARSINSAALFKFALDEKIEFDCETAKNTTAFADIKELAQHITDGQRIYIHGYFEEAFIGQPKLQVTKVRDLSQLKYFKEKEGGFCFNEISEGKQ